MANAAMTREKYMSLSVAALRDLAKELKVTGASRMRKEELVDALLAAEAAMGEANGRPDEERALAGEKKAASAGKMQAKKAESAGKQPQEAFAGTENAGAAGKQPQEAFVGAENAGAAEKKPQETFAGTENAAAAGKAPQGAVSNGGKASVGGREGRPRRESNEFRRGDNGRPQGGGRQQESGQRGDASRRQDRDNRNRGRGGQGDRVGRYAQAMRDGGYGNRGGQGERNEGRGQSERYENRGQGERNEGRGQGERYENRSQGDRYENNSQGERYENRSQGDRYDNKRTQGEPMDRYENRSTRMYGGAGQAEDRYAARPDEGILVPDKHLERSEEAAAKEFERAAKEGVLYEAGGIALPDGSGMEGVELEGRVSGVLEILPDGYGFLRDRSFLPSEEDVYVSVSQIHRFNLRTGDVVEGLKRGKIGGGRRGALVYVERVNGHQPETQDRAEKGAAKRTIFEQMTPIFPDRRIRLEREDGSTATRIVDLIAPIGYGQRGMIVSPPKAGKTTLLKDIAHSILHGDPDANLIILLIDERPEEVTDMKESVKGKNVRIVYSTFDETPENHKRVSEMVLEFAKRLVEDRKDVIILLDSITRLARACNVLVPPSGKTLSGGLDPTSLYMPKRFFGAARNMRGGGSLTILATALVDTGSKMDDVIYEEFKGTGNMELILDRKLQERRVFPAIDIVRSGTRREDLLLTTTEKRAVDIMRRRLNGAKPEDAVESLLNAFSHFPNNDEVVRTVIMKWGGDAKG